MEKYIRSFGRYVPFRAFRIPFTSFYLISSSAVTEFQEELYKSFIEFDKYRRKIEKEG